MAEVLLSNGSIHTDTDWNLLQDEQLPAEPASLPDKAVVPYSYWKENSQSLDPSRTGVFISSENLPEGEASEYQSLPIIFIDFPVFSDGRGFSIARILRDKLSYKGEIRAYGNFMQDQLSYLVRCGFSSFQNTSSDKLGEMKESLHDFSDGYQSDSNGLQAVYARK